jgi:hypothetical protein
MSLNRSIDISLSPKDLPGVPSAPTIDTDPKHKPVVQSKLRTGQKNNTDIYVLLHSFSSQIRRQNGKICIKKANADLYARCDRWP